MHEPAHLVRHADCSHVLRFDSLHRPGCSLMFPCDAHGQVDLDGLSDRMRLNYLGARALLGRDYAFPVLQPTH